MYIDLIVFIILIAAVIFFFKRFSSFIYLVCSVDIFFRLLHFLADNLPIPELKSLIGKYVPGSVADMIGKYVGTSGIIYTIVIWIMFAIYCVLLFYMVRILVKRK